MSTETETRENQVPPEVAALWTQLHAEAIRRRDDLKPATSRRWLAAVGAIAIGVVALVIVGALIARQSDQRRTEATITAAAVAAAKTQAFQQAALETRETQVAATATADWNALQTRQAETATALASATAMTATVAAIATQTATAEAAAAAAATSTAVACKDDNLYTAEVSEARNLLPVPDSDDIFVVIGGDKGLPAISASWVITNTGECMWEQLVLRRFSGPSNYDEEINGTLASGERTELSIQFKEVPENPVNAVWYLEANGKPLLDRGGRVILAIPTWIIAQTATPTPTYTPTPTPTPTATPTPRVGNLIAREPQGQRYMSEGVVFEWTYDTMLENFFRFQILARGPGNVEYPLAIPASCEPYEPQDNNHRCTVRNAGLLPVDGSYTWSVRVIDATDQVQRESNTLSFDLSREPQPVPVPGQTPNNPPGTRG